MAKPGRKSKYTPERVEKILSLLKVGNTQRNACAAAGIDMATFLRWRIRYADFALAVRTAEAEAEAFHVKTIATAAEKGSVPAAIFWLERRRNQDWGRRDQLEFINSVRELASTGNVDEEAAVKQAEQILRELRSAQRS